MFTLSISHMILSIIDIVRIIGVLRSLTYENYERVWVSFCTGLIKGEILIYVNDLWLILPSFNPQEVCLAHLSAFEETIEVPQNGGLLYPEASIRDLKVCLSRCKVI